MSLEASLSPHLQQVGSPYCSDRNCVYCSEMGIPLTQVAPTDCGLPLAFLEVWWTIR